MGPLARQRKLQQESFGQDPYERAGEDLGRSFRENVLGCTDELHEALRNLHGWKPWADSTPGDAPLQGTTEGQMIGEELADAQLFLWNLVTNCGYTDEEWEALCEQTQAKVARRREEGYDGHSA